MLTSATVCCRSRVFALVLILLAGIAGQALAQDQPQPEKPEEPSVVAEDSVLSAPVVIDGETVFQVRGSSALPAQERAGKIRQRIIAVAEQPGGRIVPLEIREIDIGKAIYHGATLIMVTTPADARLEEMDVDVLSALHVEAVSKAVADYRENRGSSARVGSAIEAVLWSIAFLVGCLLLFRYRVRLRRRLVTSAETWMSTMEKVGKDIVERQAVSNLVSYAYNVIWLVLFFLLFYLYLSFVLTAFVETRPLANILILYVTDPVVSVLYGIVSYLPNLVTLIVILMLTGLAIKGVRLFFEYIESGALHISDFEPHWVWPTFNIVRGALILIAIVFAFPYLPGSDSVAFKGITILVGIMVSLGSNSVVGNILSGIFVIYRRSTTIGDRIKVGDHVGDVLRIKLMETHIKSIKNELISIPNTQLLNSEVINYSRKTDGRGMLLHTTVGIGYEEPRDKVEAMLIEAARQTNGLKKTPVPFVLITALADYAINYQINAFTTRGSSLPKILSDLHMNIIDIFNANQVQIMTPSYQNDPRELKIPSKSWDGNLDLPGERTLGTDV